MKLTLEQVKALSDEELRVKVAKLCGWGEFHNDHYGSGFWTGPSAVDGEDPPDYPHDLNAMHVVEEGMTDAQYDTHWNELVAICVRDGRERMNSATARQRAEAFVLTMQGE